MHPHATGQTSTSKTLHLVGACSGIAAGAWFGIAEAPTKLVTTGLSPFVISAAMVMGVFVARWTVPTMLKGTSYVIADLKAMRHLLVWAIMAGALWAVANTLTVFAIRDVGLAVAFPIWNSNCLVGLLWGCLLFNELKGAGRAQWLKVAGGAVAIILATIILAHASIAMAHDLSGHPLRGILAALGAGLLWGTMYIPYRKAYLSGMNPLSFVTVFTIGELGAVTLLSIIFLGGLSGFQQAMQTAKPAIFWLFLGGFCWVLGDLFQQFAAKYIGIGRGIPLTNTNQLWGLACAALVFNEFRNVDTATVTRVVAGCLLMIAGAGAIASAEASGEERAQWDRSIEEECRRYGLDRLRVRAAMAGEDPLARESGGHAWWDFLICVAATGIFVALALGAHVPPIAMNLAWLYATMALAIAMLLVSGWLLRRHTSFS